MKISARAKLAGLQLFGGMKNAPAYAISKLSFPTADIGPERLGMLSTMVGELVDVTITLSPFVDGSTGRSGRQARLDEAAPAAAAVVLSPRAEIPRPLEEEECRRCGLRIGPDPDRRFYTPTAGPPQPMHGACAGAAVVEFFGGGDAPPAAAGGDAAALDGRAVYVEVPRVEDAPDEPTAADADWIAQAVGEIADGIAAEDGAPAPEPVPVELAEPVATAPATEEEGWPFTSDPPRDAAAELPPHLAPIATASDAAFDGLGPSESTRRGRRPRVTGAPATP